MMFIWSRRLLFLILLVRPELLICLLLNESQKVFGVSLENLIALFIEEEVIGNNFLASFVPLQHCFVGQQVFLVHEKENSRNYFSLGFVFVLVHDRVLEVQDRVNLGVGHWKFIEQNFVQFWELLNFV